MCGWMTNRHQTSHNSALTEENQTSWHTSNLQPMFCSHTEWQTSKHCIHHRSLYSEKSVKKIRYLTCLLMSAVRPIHFSRPINTVLVVIMHFGPCCWDASIAHFISYMALLVIVISCDDVMVIAQLCTWSMQVLSRDSDPSHRSFYSRFTGEMNLPVLRTYYECCCAFSRQL